MRDVFDENKQKMKKMSELSSQFWAIVSGVSALITIIFTLYNPFLEYITEKRMILLN